VAKRTATVSASVEVVSMRLYDAEGGIYQAEHAGVWDPPELVGWPVPLYRITEVKQAPDGIVHLGGEVICGYCGGETLTDESDPDHPSFSHANDSTPLCTTLDGWQAPVLISARVRFQIPVNLPDGFPA
jgi:hypothetical protein